MKSAQQTASPSRSLPFGPDPARAEKNGRRRHRRRAAANRCRSQTRPAALQQTRCTQDRMTSWIVPFTRNPETCGPPSPPRTTVRTTLHAKDVPIRYSSECTAYLGFSTRFQGPCAGEAHASANPRPRSWATGVGNGGRGRQSGLMFAARIRPAGWAGPGEKCMVSSTLAPAWTRRMCVFSSSVVMRASTNVITPALRVVSVAWIAFALPSLRTCGHPRCSPPTPRDTRLIQRHGGEEPHQILTRFRNARKFPAFGPFVLSSSTR